MAFLKVVAIYALLVCKISGPNIWSCDSFDKSNVWIAFVLLKGRANAAWLSHANSQFKFPQGKNTISVCPTDRCWNYGRQLFSICYHSNMIIIFAFKVPLYLCVQEINVENMEDNYFRCPPSRFQIPDRPPFHLIYCPNMRLLTWGIFYGCFQNMLWQNGS